jgi:hypothetical protein
MTGAGEAPRPRLVHVVSDLTGGAAEAERGTE